CALARLRLHVDEGVLLDTTEVLLLARGRHDSERHRIRAGELLAGVYAGDRHLHRARERIDELDPVAGPDAVVLGLVLRQQDAARRHSLRAAGADVEVEDAFERGRVDGDDELLTTSD